MKRDLQNREDIYKLVKHFYVKLMNDAEMRHFFIHFKNSSALEEHLHELVDFWDSMLFFSAEYRKNAMQPHVALHQKKPISKKHFKSWLSSFNESLDELFEGQIAQFAKTKALSIATVMEIKISQANT